MLRFGVIVGPTLRAWELDCVRELEASGLARLELVVRHGGIPGRIKEAHAFNELSERCGATTQGLYSSLELARITEAVLAVDPDIDAESWKGDVAKAGLDFVLLFAPRTIAAQMEASARLGIWTFAHGELARYECSVPGFWELYRGNDLTAGSLLKLSAEGIGVPLKSAHLATVRRSLSLNIDSICSLMSKWPALVCRNIEDGVAEYFSDEPVPQPAQRFGWPNLLQALAVWLLERGTRASEYLRARFFSIDWNVGVLDRAPSDFIGKDERPRARYLFRGNSYDYVADPCVVTRGSQTFLFCERYDHRTRRGFLVQTELVNGKAAPLNRIIDESHHLSYPHVFEYEGELYCVPESRAARKVCLYRALEFPQRWELVRTLLDGFDAADSTLVRHNGKWWLFCTSGALMDRGFNSDLYVWYADDLFGEWTPHVRNPLKMDVRSARSAGPAFVHEGTLYRPVQDCGGSYGGRIHIARIDVLNEREFHETLVGTIRPPVGRYARGIHTISYANGVCAIDARRYAFSPWRMVVALRRLGERTGLKRRLVRGRLPVPVIEAAESAAALPASMDSTAALK